MCARTSGSSPITERGKRWTKVIGRKEKKKKKIDKTHAGQGDERRGHGSADENERGSARRGHRNADSANRCRRRRVPPPPRSAGGIAARPATLGRRGTPASPVSCFDFTRVWRWPSALSAGLQSGMFRRRRPWRRRWRWRPSGPDRHARRRPLPRDLELDVDDDGRSQPPERVPVAATESCRMLSNTLPLHPFHSDGGHAVSATPKSSPQLPPTTDRPSRITSVARGPPSTMLLHPERTENTRRPRGNLAANWTETQRVRVTRGVVAGGPHVTVPPTFERRPYVVLQRRPFFSD